jgi:hypothetical protein
MMGSFFVELGGYGYGYGRLFVYNYALRAALLFGRVLCVIAIKIKKNTLTPNLPSILFICGEPVLCNMRD